MAESPELSESGGADSGPASREEVTHELGAVQGGGEADWGFRRQTQGGEEEGGEETHY